MVKDRFYVVFGIICKKISKMPVHCTEHHHHQLGFFSTPTPIKDSVGDDGGEEACSAGRAADGICYKKQRRVVEIEIRVEIET